ncbi:MAG: hypothetical protein KDK99_19895, partial [Verrucomicrobiales bacterium]|nr:hypothetical protein [Verrucomicrobiales bacterium]
MMIPLRHLLFVSCFAMPLSILAETAGNRAQFDAQRRGQFVYTPFTAMSSPVVLPMDGRIEEADWLTGLDVSWGGVLFPHL